MNLANCSTNLCRHLSGQSIGHFPVWMMRQAGRYLPGYQAIRQKYSFWEMVKESEIAAQVTLLPFNYFELDAAILFSDILTLPFSLKLPITMQEKIGPVVTEPLSNSGSFKIFEEYQAEVHTKFVADAIGLVRKKLTPSTALIGFAGAPWTVACYLIEGHGKTDFRHIRQWMNQDPKDLTLSLQSLAKATVSYLKLQVTAGAQVIQLFDTWATLMEHSFFTEFYAPLLVEVFSELGRLEVPLIYFGKGINSFLDSVAKLPVHVIGVDQFSTLSDFDKRLQGKFSLQGNFDPQVLLKAEPEFVRQKARALVEEAKTLSKPAILNLGHGILPQTPMENVRVFLDETRTLWI